MVTPTAVAALCAYVRDGRHLQPDGNVKALRAIAQDCGTTHATASKYLDRYFPDVMRKYHAQRNPRGGSRWPKVRVPRTWGGP
jgi:hypothetical protein